jgi:isoaspartyl peptidase/L-asparaginase-like protein (Ntn-hydrolase superfamily)
MVDDTRKFSGSKSTDRPWASNDKLQFDNVMAHCKVLEGYSELAMKQAIEFQQKSNDAYLAERDRRETQRLEHENELETHRQENNRYSLDYLYGVYPQETVGVVAIAQALVDLLKKEGLAIKK